MKVEDRVLVCHHDWMPDGRVILEPGIITAETEVQGEKVLGVDIYYEGSDGKETKEGFAFFPVKNTSKDYYWLEEWDPKYKERMESQLKKDIEEGKVIDAADVLSRLPEGARATKKNPRRPKSTGVRKTGRRATRVPVRVRTHKFVP